MLQSRYQIFLKAFNVGLKALFIAFIYFYRAVLKPLMSGSPSCRFYPSCSEYSKTAFEKHRPLKAIMLTLKRLFRCNPLGSYGYDPVPPSAYGAHNK